MTDDLIEESLVKALMVNSKSSNENIQMNSQEFNNHQSDIERG